MLWYCHINLIEADDPHALTAVLEPYMDLKGGMYTPCPRSSGGGGPELQGAATLLLSTLLRAGESWPKARVGSGAGSGWPSPVDSLTPHCGKADRAALDPDDAG